MSSGSSSSSTSIFVSTLRPPPVGSLSLPLRCSFSSFQQQQLHPQACSISKYGVELGRGPVLAGQSLSLLNWTKWKWKWIAAPITTTTAARFPQLRATAAATNDWAAAAAAAATPSGEEEGERELQLQPNPQNHPKFHEIVSAVPPTVFAFLMKSRGSGGASNFLVWFCVATAFFVIAVRAYAVRRSKCSRPPGSVADLVRRGQLRSDRRGISRPLKYEDPFNNPLVKVSKSNSTVEMCGKVYRLAPVTLTEEQQAIHQKRRSRAYQWKRPTVFLKEGDSIPPDVDPDTVRWIPANHPFATTASDIDEDLAQNNVYQKHGVPFRIQAEHEALQRKLEALQREQKLDKLVIDTGSAKDFERPFKLNQKSNELVEESPFKNRAGDSKPLKSDGAPSSLGGTSSSEDAKRS